MKDRDPLRSLFFREQARPEVDDMAQDELLIALKKRFLAHLDRHPGIVWDDVEARIAQHEHALPVLTVMEATGGEPDVVDRDEATGALLFFDCSPESPQGRRNTCYDSEGELARNKKGVYPAGNALDQAREIGIELLDEEAYRFLQTRGSFDQKTSSWLKTPEKIRKLGGALFADRRYEHVFVYHNSAPSFYRSRGFRGLLRV